MKPIAVSALAKYIKKTLDVDYFLADLAVEGEISNLKDYPSGHCFFTLKDDKSSISCLIYRWDKEELDLYLREGSQVIVRGGVSLYEGESRIHFYVKEVEEKGKGALYQAFLKTKDKLEKEGLFKKEYKKPIPPLATHIGVVTSRQGAVIQDIINVLKRRNPGVNLTLYPCQVQGLKAAESIERALSKALENKDLDLIILGRGGGSFEDLFAFQDEDLARMIFQADLPIISAVGHETDYSISDFVADLRAPTPSAAAELAVAKLDDLVLNLDLSLRRAKQKMAYKIQIAKDQIQEKKTRLHPYSLDLVLGRKKLDLRAKMYGLKQEVKSHLDLEKGRTRGKKDQTLYSLSQVLNKQELRVQDLARRLRSYSREEVILRKKTQLKEEIYQAWTYLKRETQGKSHSLFSKKVRIDLLVQSRLDWERSWLLRRSSRLEKLDKPKKLKNYVKTRGQLLTSNLARFKVNLGQEAWTLSCKLNKVQALAGKEQMHSLQRRLRGKMDWVHTRQLHRIQEEKTKRIFAGQALEDLAKAFPRAYVLKDGKLVDSIKVLNKNDHLKLYLAHGQVGVRVEDLKQEKGDKNERTFL